MGDSLKCCGRNVIYTSGFRRISCIIGKFDELPYDDSGVQKAEFPLQANFSNLAPQYLSTMRRASPQDIVAQS